MLDRAGIALLAQKRLEQFIAKRPEQAHLFSIKMTSGTTSEPLVSMLDNPPRYFVAFSKLQRIVACYGSLAIRLANALYVRHQKTEYPLRILLLDPGDLVPGFEALFADFSPDAMRGFPSFIIRASERVPIEATANIAYVQVAGELLTNARISFLKEHFPQAAFQRAYLSAEIGLISDVDCGFLPFNRYHPVKDVTVDIDTPDENGSGTLLVTKMLDEGVYAEKYRIGDTARWIKELCACGNPLTFEVLGREGYDYIKILGCQVRAEEAERIFAKYANLFDTYRIDVEEIHAEGKIKGKLTLRTYNKKWFIADNLIQSFLEDFNNSFFMTPTKTFGVLVKEGLFEPVVLLQETSPFVQGPKEFKLRMKK